MRISRKTSVLCAFLILSTVFFAELASTEAIETERSATDYANTPLYPSVDASMLESHVWKFVSFGSRVTGYPGCTAAAQYIADAFKGAGLDVLIQNYSTAIPVDEGSRLAINTDSSFNCTVHALWPNGVQCSPTPQEGLTGKLIYVGNGSIKEFNGLEVSRAIVLMDFDSGDNWLTAADLGAKAVVFLPAVQASAQESLLKAVPTPIHFPRAYVSDQKDAARLRTLASNNTSATLYVKMSWKQIEASNVIGIVRGVEHPSDIIVISSHYDSWSSVPGIAPGGEEAVSTALLIELAKHYSASKPLRTIWFVAFSGYWQSLTGPVEWVEENVFSEANLDGSHRIWLQIGLDFSSERPMMDALFLGHNTYFGENAVFASRYLWVESSLKGYCDEAIDELSEMMGLPRDVFVRTFFKGTMDWGTQSSFYMLGTEPITQTYSMGFSLRTQYSERLKWLSPLSDEKIIGWENIVPQVKIASAIVNGFANEKTWELVWDSTKPSRFTREYSAIVSSVGGFVRLDGEVAEFDLETNWYTSIDNPLVGLSRVTSFSSGELVGVAAQSTELTYLYWPFLSRYTVADSDGRFTFYGLTPRSTWDLQAWKFDPIDGHVIYAVDEGMYGTATGISGGISRSVYVLTEVSSVLVPVFRCAEIAVFNLRDPWTLKPELIVDPRNPLYFSFQSRISPPVLYDATSKSRPVFYGYHFSPAYSVGMFFVRPESRVVINLNPEPTQHWPLVILSNSSQLEPEGQGYYVDRSLVITHGLRDAAISMYNIGESRYSPLVAQNVRSQGVEFYLNLAFDELNLAEDYFQQLSYDKAYAHWYASLSFSSKAYANHLMPVYEESSATIVFFTFLALPFAIFFEQLVLHSSSMKRVVSLFLIGAISLWLLSLLHPGFKIIGNSAMSILGVFMILLGAFIIFIFTKEVRDLLDMIAASKLGAHVFTTEKPRAIIYSFEMAVKNMRTRKLMTALTLATIIILAAAQTSLTSASYRVDVLQSPVYGEINRESGLLLKVGYGTPHDPSDILSSETSRQVEALFGEDFLVSPRVWYYPVSTYPSGISIRALSQSGYYLLGSVVILGLSFSESKEAFFFEGPALSNIPNSVLLPSTIAKTLNVTLGDSIYIDCVGQPLVVSGIFSVEVSAGLSDYDGGSILPIDPRYQQVLGLISSPLTQLPPENIPITNVIVVPSEIASSLGGFVSSIALLPKHPLTNEEMRTTAESLSLLTGVTVYLKTNTVSVGLYFITRPSVIGVWGLALLLVISVLSIINTIVGTVERRKKEIVTYSSLGLSPGGAFLMFLMESLTYALLGALIGYILGFSLSQLFINLQLLPADFVFNSSSLFVMLSLLTLFLATTGAAIYPSVLASRQITPSLERKWSLATRPRGSIWSIPLPFRFAFEYEVLGILVFLAEYYGGMGYEKKTFQVRNVYEVEKGNRSLQLDVALIPLELGIMQKVTLQAVPSKMRAEYGLHILIELVRGDPHTWESKNYPFIDDIRKQILIWRTMKTEEKEKYTSAVRSLN